MTAPMAPDPTLKVPVVLMLLADLALKLRVAPINQYVGCWEYELGGGWWFAVNGHRAPVPCSRGLSVPPFAAYFEYNGWPAGIVEPAGGVMAAGAVVNEDALIAALRAARGAT